MRSPGWSAVGTQFSSDEQPEYPVLCMALATFANLGFALKPPRAQTMFGRSCSVIAGVVAMQIATTDRRFLASTLSTYTSFMGASASGTVGYGTKRQIHCTLRGTRAPPLRGQSAMARSDKYTARHPERKRRNRAARAKPWPLRGPLRGRAASGTVGYGTKRQIHCTLRGTRVPPLRGRSAMARSDKYTARHPERKRRNRAARAKPWPWSPTVPNGLPGAP